VSDGGKSLYVAAEQAGEGLGLRFAQLREFLCHVRDRAMMLAHLVTAGGVACRRGETVDRQRIGKSLWAIAGFRGRDERTVSLFEVRDAVAGEGHDGGVATGLGQESKCVYGKLVILLIEPVPAGLGHDEHFGRATTPAVPVDSLLAGLDRAVGKQLVQMSAHGRRSQPKPLGKLDRRGRTFFQNAFHYAFTGRRVFDDRRVIDPNVFHNTIVPLINVPINKGEPKCPAAKPGKKMGCPLRRLVRCPIPPPSRFGTSPCPTAKCGPSMGSA